MTIGSLQASETFPGNRALRGSSTPSQGTTFSSSVATCREACAMPNKLIASAIIVSDNEGFKCNKRSSPLA